MYEPSDIKMSALSQAYKSVMYILNCCLQQVTMRTSKRNISSSFAYGHAFLLSWILSDYLARNQFKICWNRWLCLWEQALLQHGPKHLRWGKERQTRYFFFICKNWFLVQGIKSISVLLKILGKLWQGNLKTCAIAFVHLASEWALHS